MKNSAIIFALFFFTLTLTSCSTFIQQHPDNQPVRLIQKNELNIISSGQENNCEYRGEIIGSEGHWYTYLFLSNRNLMQGALNDVYNRANEMNANVVFISDDVAFVTSVTFYGQAYYCK